MRAISQYPGIFNYAIELKDLINLKFEMIEYIEDIIHCKMTNSKGCIGSFCMYFKYVKTTLTEGEDRCYFAPVYFPSKHCSIQHIVLGRHKNPQSERIEELISILNKEIPNEVERWRDRDHCKFDSIKINKDNNEIHAVWKIFALNQCIRIIEEDIFNPDSMLVQEKKKSIRAVISDFFKR